MGEISVRAPAVLAWDTVARCHRVLPGFQCILVDSYGTNLTAQYVVTMFDAEEGWFMAWDGPRLVKFKRRGLQLRVAPAIAEQKAQTGG